MGLQNLFNEGCFYWTHADLKVATPLKILEMNLKKGIAKVVPETLDDLWHLFNIVAPRDEVYARTTREVRVEEPYARPKKGKRVSVFLGVRVEKVFWDRSLNRLRAMGTVCEAPEDLNVTGSHHTLNISIDKPLTVVKSEWLRHQIDRLERASRAQTAPITVMAIDDEEYCVAVLRQYGVDVRGEERTRLPGKLEVEKREKALQEFFRSGLASLRSAWTGVHSPIVVIGPGFVKNDFVKYARREAVDVGKAIIDVKGVNSGGVAGIHEALRSGVLTKALRNVRIAEETRLVEEALARLGMGKQDAAYGFPEVEKASGYGAIEKLLIADAALRETTDERRVSLENVMREVENKGGQIVVVSAEYEAGQKLLSLGGVAALLRFPTG